MKNTEKLMDDISNAEGHTSQIESDLEALDKELNDIHTDLETSKKVNYSLHRLDTSLDMASKLLTVVGIIPSISKGASTLKNMTDKFHTPIKKAVKESDAVEKIVKPIREKIEKIEPKVEKVDNVLLDTINTENQFIETLGRTEQCINFLPDSSAKSELEKQMESASSKMDPMVLNFDRAQVKLLKSVEDAQKSADKIEAWAQSLIDLDIQIKRAIATLSPLIRSLNAIAAAFKQTIRVPYGGYPKICYKKMFVGKVPHPCGWRAVYYSFTIKQILDGVTGVIKPVMDQLNKIMNYILQPLIRAFVISIGSYRLPDIPGLGVLNELKDNLKADFDSITGTLDDLMDDLNMFTGFMEELQGIIDKIEEINKECRGHQ